MKKNILVALQSFSEYSGQPIAILQKSKAELIMNKSGHRLNQQEIIELGGDCEGIIAGVEPYDKNVLNHLKNLKCISRCGVGVDNIDMDLAREKGITVLNTPEAVVQPVVEMTIAMIFALLRKLAIHTNLIKKGEWRKDAGKLLCGSKAGIIGLGRIGKKVAVTLKLLGARVYASDIKPDLLWAKSNGVTVLPVDELLSLVDILSIHVSIEKDATFVLGEREITKLKKGCVIINTSRGKAIDEVAFYRALSSNFISAAGLDVFTQEPYQGPLSSLDNVILTPHIATLTEESRTEMEIEAVKNLLMFFGVAV